MGGNGVKKLFSQWTKVNFQRKIFRIYYNEIDCVILQNEDNEFRGQKKKLADYLTEKRCKKAKIEQKLKEAAAKNKEITGKFQTKNLKG